MSDLIVSGVLAVSICGALEGSLFLGLLGIWSAGYLFNDLMSFIV
jgi:hypothetical protein